jgi:hypothetical protein
MTNVEIKCTENTNESNILHHLLDSTRRNQLDLAHRFNSKVLNMQDSSIAWNIYNSFFAAITYQLDDKGVQKYVDQYAKIGGFEDDNDKQHANFNLIF